MSKIIVQKKAAITVIAINRPDVRNAVDAETATLLANAFRAFDADEEARVAILCGTGNIFCAGADLKALAQSKQKEEPAMRLSETGDAPMGVSRLKLSKPVIAAIDGHAVAGGLELALWCDLRVADPDAVLGVFCRRWGVPLIDGGTVRLPRLIGLSHALDLILTGRAVYANEALQMGLVNRISPSGKVRETAEALAVQIAQFPQACLRSDRQSAHEQFDLTFDQAMLNEFRKGIATINTGETLSGAKRFASGKGRHGTFEDI